MLEEPPTVIKIDIRNLNVSILSSLLNHQKVGKDKALQYRVKGCHEAAAGSLKFDMVQAETEQRKQIGCFCSGSGVFSGKLICNGFYRQKV